MLFDLNRFWHSHSESWRNRMECLISSVDDISAFIILPPPLVSRGPLHTQCVIQSPCFLLIPMLLPTCSISYVAHSPVMRILQLSGSGPQGLWNLDVVHWTQHRWTKLSLLWLPETLWYFCLFTLNSNNNLMMHCHISSLHCYSIFKPFKAKARLNNI
jgi:hypothetical protein